MAAAAAALTIDEWRERHEGLQVGDRLVDDPFALLGRHCDLATALRRIKVVALVVLQTRLEPMLKTVPRSVLWGFFIYMGLEALEGSQFWERIQLMLAEKAQLEDLLKTHEVKLLALAEI